MLHFGRVPRSSGLVAAVLSVGMALQMDRRRAPRALRPAAVVLLAAAMISCGGAAPTGESGQSVSVQAGAATHEPAVAGPASTGSAGSEAVPAGIDGSGLLDCEDVAKITASVQGPLRTTQNYPPGFVGAVLGYGSQFDTFGGYWLDRDNGGTIMVGFTDEVEMHEAALLALPPSPVLPAQDSHRRIAVVRRSPRTCGQACAFAQTAVVRRRSCLTGYRSKTVRALSPMKARRRSAGNMSTSSSRSSTYSGVWSAWGKSLAQMNRS